MKMLKSYEELASELHKENLLLPDKIQTKGYGQLRFDCGCGQSHGVNDQDVQVVGTYLPVKIIFKCPRSYTKVQIKGLFKQKCLSLWAVPADVVDDLFKIPKG